MNNKNLLMISLLFSTNVSASHIREAILAGNQRTPVVQEDQEVMEMHKVHSSLVHAISWDKIEDFKESFNKKATCISEEVLGGYGESLLTFAISKNRINFVEFLIRQNFNVNCGALEAVMKNEVPQPLLLEMLLAAGADPRVLITVNLTTSFNGFNVQSETTGHLDYILSFRTSKKRKLRKRLKDAVARGLEEYKKRQEYYPEYVALIKNEIAGNLAQVNDLAAICIEYIFAHLQVVPGMTLSDYIRPALEDNAETDEETTQLIITTEK